MGERPDASGMIKAQNKVVWVIGAGFDTRLVDISLNLVYNFPSFTTNTNNMTDDILTAEMIRNAFC